MWVPSFTTHLLLPTENCNCFSVFWWAWFSNCPSVSPSNTEPIWIYFGYRFISIVHGSYFAITRTSVFDNADKWDRENPCDPCNKCREGEQLNDTCICHPCQGCNYCGRCKRKEQCHVLQHLPIVPIQDTNNDIQRSRNNNICPDCNICTRCGRTNESYLLNGLRFSEHRMTTSTSFLENSALALLSMISAEVTMNINEVQKNSPLYSVGQVTALVIAGGTAIRALWVFLYMFHPKTYSTYQERTLNFRAHTF